MTDEAGVKVTCRRCKRERLLDRNRLMETLRLKGLDPSWEKLPAYLLCPCGAKQADIIAMPFTSGDEDGEALFEALLRAYKRSETLIGKRTDAEWCKAASDSSRELHVAKTAMRAWIVARSRA